MARATTSARLKHPRSKTPDEFQAKDWIAYLVQGILRETGRPWKPAQYVTGTWVRVIADRIKSGADPYKLALALDLTAGRWRDKSAESPWRILSPETLHQTFAEKPSWLWRAAWFSRFAAGTHQVEYYRYWLMQAEIAHSLGEGLSGRAALLTSSRDHLSKAEAKLLATRPPATFELHVLKDWNV